MSPPRCPRRAGLPAALAAGVTIDAQQNSRVLLFDPSTGDLTLSGLTLTGGLASGSGNGGGVIDPLLGPLQNNGGPTQTHALLVGSPAIDAGDPAVGNTPLFDQRGTGFDRVLGGRLDIGAFESVAPSADFDSDGDVDGADFLAWQRGFGTTAPNATKTDGDADNDTAVDGADLTVWQGQFGQPVSPVVAAVGSEPLIAAATSADQVLDEAIVELFDAAFACRGDIC